jgi:uncharacterized protein YjbJ (UPF0337 family)
MRIGYWEARHQAPPLFKGESKMKLSTNDQATGKLHEVKGAIKEKVGELANDPNLEANGNAEKIAGKIQNIVGKIEKAVGE